MRGARFVLLVVALWFAWAMNNIDTRWSWSLFLELSIPPAAILGAHYLYRRGEAFDERKELDRIWREIAKRSRALRPR